MTDVAARTRVATYLYEADTSSIGGLLVELAEIPALHAIVSDLVCAGDLEVAERGQLQWHGTSMRPTDGELSIAVQRLGHLRTALGEARTPLEEELAAFVRKVEAGIATCISARP